MSSRISTPFMFSQGVETMLRKQAELSHSELQLADGKRILRPSEDAAATARLQHLKESSSKLDQFQRNADAATGRLSQEESVLEGVGNLLQRVRELTVQGNNDTLNLTDRKAIAAEVRQHMESFVQLANTRDANGEYIFSGYETDTPALRYTPPVAPATTGTFDYDGDSGQRMVRLGDTREVATGDPGDIFMDLPASAGGDTNIGAVIESVAAHFEAGDAYQDGLADLDTAIDRISLTRAGVGARMHAIEEQKTTNDDFKLAIEQVRSSLEDLDYAEAISRFNQQLLALQASQQSFVKIQDLNLFNFLR